MINGEVLAGGTTFNRHANGVRAHAVGVGVKHGNAIPRIAAVGQRRSAHYLLVPKLCLETGVWKLRFPGRKDETLGWEAELPLVRSQAELGNE